MNVIGQRFGNGFQLLREIGRGALARVFLASDGRTVKAVKLFPRTFRNRADLELRYGRHLDHPHLNPIDSLVEIVGYPGVIMPFVAGRRLALWHRQMRDRAAFLTSFAGILEALAYLHERDIIHRDIKPENVLVASNAHAKLIDFDLAVYSGEERRRRALAGTVAYLSPEQARGEVAGKASDLYSAGIILYWGLTGEVPFTGSVEEVIHDHRFATPRAVSTFDARLQPFDALVASLLAKDAGERLSSAQEALTRLTRLRRYL